MRRGPALKPSKDGDTSWVRIEVRPPPPPLPPLVLIGHAASFSPY